jgi:hypothetical protein
MSPDDDYPDVDLPAFALVNCIAQVDLAHLQELLHRRGFLIINLNGKLVRDKATLLAQAEADLPPVAGMRPGNWDALADYLWNGLHDLDHDQVALLWTDADQIVHGDLQDFLDGLRVFTSVADSVRDGAAGSPRSTTLLIFLVGDGPEFRRLEA